MILFLPALLGAMKSLAMKTALGKTFANASQAQGPGGVLAALMGGGGGASGGGASAAAAPDMSGAGSGVAPVVGNVLGTGGVVSQPTGGLDEGQLMDFMGTVQGGRRKLRMPF